MTHAKPLLLLLALGLVACAPQAPANHNEHAPGALATTASPAGAQASASPADLAFLDGMVPHHEAAVVMADEAAVEAQRAELKAFAAQVKKDQGEEIAQMKAWRKAWFGSDQAPAGHAHPVKPLPKGAAYDAAWAEEMVVHHQGALDMAQLALKEAKQPELRALAQRIIDSQSAEIEKLKAWAKAWKP